MEILNISHENYCDAAKIYCDSWKAGYKGIVPQSYLDSLTPEHCFSVLNNDKIENFILEEGGNFIAVSSISPARDIHMAGWGELCTIYVSPKYFRRGYGEILFNFSINRLREKGFDKIYLWVFKDNLPARSFYEKLGFFPDGKEDSFYIGGKKTVDVRYTNA